MKRWLFVVLFTGILTLLSYGYVLAKEPVDTRGTRLQYVSEFEGGKLYRAGQVRVLELTGSYRQMGRQYGDLAKDDLRAMHTTTVRFF